MDITHGKRQTGSFNNGASFIEKQADTKPSVRSFHKAASELVMQMQTILIMHSFNEAPVYNAEHLQWTFTKSAPVHLNKTSSQV